MNELLDARYVSWNEGAAILGMDRPSFFYYVKRGKIRKEPNRRPRDGRYNLADINKLHKERTSGVKQKHQRPIPRPPVFLDWLSPLDIPAILKLDQIVYNEMYLAEAGVYKSWSEKNPMLAMAAFDASKGTHNRDTMLAYVAALPLDEEVILAIMRHEREEISITVDEMQSYDRPGAYTLLANSAVTHPDRPDLLYKVLYRMMAHWIDQYPERYITRIYSQPVSDRGDMMIQHFFMQPRYDLASNAYMLDLARPGASKIIRFFQKQIEQKAPLPDELKQPYDKVS